MRIIVTLAAAALLAACSNGTWHRETSTLSFTFDSLFSGRTSGDTARSKIMPPAFGQDRSIADVSEKPIR